ncbi:DNA binding protein SWC2 isoform X2 [Tasmannia lanceolata]|uniref:DNA binding protein SWC2 isoform X2 n=1 Tax=Tasmannia lanceolata TaxID=3420 RepID=UPI004063CC6E
MAASKDESIVLQHSSRATRGKRMTKLLDEEIEEDEQFWNQDALKDEEDDVNYQEEVEVADVFDSDFDEDEPEPDDEVENVADDRERVKKRLIFPGKPVTKKKNKKKVLSKLERIPEDEKSLQGQQSNLPECQDIPDDLEGERIVRKSTRTSVIVRQAERDAIRAALQASMKPFKRRKEGEEKRMSQEEMLLEAAQTEIMNLRNLERVLAREEEVKKRAVVHKEVYSGPQIRYSSRDGKSFLEFSKGLSFQSEICTTPVPYPEKAICVVTALAAKYRDPKTGLPYATKEAFKIIRERFSQEENNRAKMEKMDMGYLFESISGQGFLVRRKRSRATNTAESLDLRLGARFLRIPVLQNHALD